MILALLLLPFASLVLTCGRARRGVVLFAGTGWIVMIATLINANYDPRYPEVVLGMFAAASAPALPWAAELAGRARARTVRPARS
jgi:hypothetical protein